MIGSSDGRAVIIDNRAASTDYLLLFALDRTTGDERTRLDSFELLVLSNVRKEHHRLRRKPPRFTASSDLDIEMSGGCRGVANKRHRYSRERWRKSERLEVDYSGDAIPHQFFLLLACWPTES